MGLKRKWAALAAGCLCMSLCLLSCGNPVKPEKAEQGTEVKEETNEEPLLSDISGIEPGTVLDAEELDLSRPEQYFQIQEINEEIRGEISGKSYTENPDIFLEDLRYLKVLHYNYEHQIQVGELIVNRKIAEDCRNIFLELFQAEYEIFRCIWWTGTGQETEWTLIQIPSGITIPRRLITGWCRGRIVCLTMPWDLPLI